MAEIIALIAVALILSDPKAVARIVRGVAALFRDATAPLLRVRDEEANDGQDERAADEDEEAETDASEETLIALARLVRAGKISAAVAVEVGLSVRRGGRARRYLALRERIETLARATGGDNDEIVGIDERGRVIRQRSDGSRYVVDAATRSKIDGGSK